MSNDVMKAITQRLADDPELRERVKGAATAGERREILEGAGLTLPSEEEFQQWQELADVAGGADPLMVDLGNTFPPSIPGIH